MSKDKHAGKCRSCRHYDGEKAKNKAGAFMNHFAAPCLWRPETPIVVPLSAMWTLIEGVRMVNEDPKRALGHREPNDTGCPCWEKIK